MIRAAAIGRRLFQADGIQVHDKWTPIPGEPAKVRAFLTRFVPRWIRLHPDDAAKLGALGLRLEGARIVDAAPDETKPAAPAKPAAKKESAPARA